MCEQLDLGEVRSWLAEDVDWGDGVQLGDLRLTRVWPGRHRRLALEFGVILRFDTYSRECRLQAMRESAEFRHSVHMRARLRTHGLAGLRLGNDRLGLWCATPDRDPRLPLVRDLLNRRRSAAALGREGLDHVFELGCNGARVRCEIKAYRLSKRCALIASFPGSRTTTGLFVKAFRRALGSGQVNMLRELGAQLPYLSNGKVRLPLLVHYSLHNRLLITEALDPEAGSLGPTGEDVGDAAAALAALHRWPAPAALRLHSANAELETVRRWAPALRALRIGGDRWLQQFVSELARLAPHVPTSSTTVIHRDFFSDQLRRSGDVLWMLDLDTISVGHPELDVATFLAHLCLDGCSTGKTDREIDGLCIAFLERYREGGARLADGRLQFYVPCALARLGAIHSARGIPREVRDRLWQRAGAHMGGPSGLW